MGSPAGSQSDLSVLHDAVLQSTSGVTLRKRKTPESPVNEITEFRTEFHDGLRSYRQDMKNMLKEFKQEMTESFKNMLKEQSTDFSSLREEFSEVKKQLSGFEKTTNKYSQECASIKSDVTKLLNLDVETKTKLSTLEKDLSDAKVNISSLTDQLRTKEQQGRLNNLEISGVTFNKGPIGIATLRYSNMPYQGWDMRPDPNGKGVLLTVTGACVTVTWICVGNAVKLKWIANATTRALKEHFGKKFSVKGMVQVMRAAACDFFPDFDGHNHLEGTCPKEWVIERHVYHAMAMLSRAYNFQWSRWNVGAGSRNIVMQLREAVDKKREAKFNLLYTNPKQATILKCNELSNELTLEPMVGLGYYPDLFTLNMSYGSADARRATFNVKFNLVETVFEMLQELKLSSYS